MGRNLGIIALALLGCRGSDGTSAADAARITALEDEIATLSTQLAALQEQVDGAVVTQDDLDGVATEAWIAEQGYATETWVEDQGYLTAQAVDGRISDALPAGDLATEAWVAANYATDGEVTAAIAGALPPGTIATEAWVDDHTASIAEVNAAIAAALPAEPLATQAWVDANYVAAGDLAGAITAALPPGDLATEDFVAAALDDALPDGDLATEDFVATAINDALPDDLATEAWVDAGYVAESRIGSGLTVTGSRDVELDLAAVAATARSVAYDTEEELTNLLDDRYVPILGGVGGDFLLDGAVRLGGADASCTGPDDVGMVQYLDGNFVGCTPDGWLVFGSGSDGSSPASAGDACAQIHLDFPSYPSGPYWIRGSGSPYQVYCDMTTDGGGWTLMATISGADGNHWNTQDGYWTDEQPLGSVQDPWLDLKSPAFYDLDVPQGAEVLFQRRYDGIVRGVVVMDESCLHGVERFVDLFTGWDQSLRCEVGDLTVLQSSPVGVSGTTYAEGDTYGLGGSGTNGFCWNGQDNNSNTFQGRVLWNQYPGSGCNQPGHLGGIGVFWNGDASQYTNSDITGTNWLYGTDYTKTDISLFVR